MLARDVKMKTVARQAGFIKMKFEFVKALDESDGQFGYKGHIFPEVREKIEQDENVAIYSEMRRGIPITFFTLKDMQRKYIENKLIEQAEDEDGDPSFVYRGHISEKNLEYFKNEGYIAICSECPEESSPIVIFLPDDEKLVFTPQELSMFDKFNQYDDKFNEKFAEWMRRKIDDEDDSDEEF